MATISTRRAADGTVSHQAKVRLKGHPCETATFARITDAKPNFDDHPDVSPRPH